MFYEVVGKPRDGRGSTGAFLWREAGEGVGGGGLLLLFFGTGW